MAWWINKINQGIIAEEANWTWFHGYPSILFVQSVIKEFELSSLFFVDDSIGSDEAISEGGFAMVDMGNNGNIPYFVGGWKKVINFFESGILSYHCCLTFYKLNSSC